MMAQTNIISCINVLYHGTDEYQIKMSNQISMSYVMAQMNITSRITIFTQGKYNTEHTEAHKTHR